MIAFTEPLSSTGVAADDRSRFLVVESETPDERERRRESAGHSAGESYAATLRQMVPGCEVELIAPGDDDAPSMTSDAIVAFDAVFLSGSRVHAYDDTQQVRRLLDFTRAVYASGTPAFGSCAGLQLAVVAAGGTVRPMGDCQEAGIARRITATEQGRDHPLLAGRPPSWDALVIHADEVELLPDDSRWLATNSIAGVQAVEIRHGAGLFWGVQYHPELAPGEMAAALRRSARSIVEDGLAGSTDEVEAQADLLDLLHADPDRRDVRWRLGVDDEVAHEERRRNELRNFLDHVVAPTRARRHAEQRETLGA